MSKSFATSVCVGERLQVVRKLDIDQCKAALENRTNDRLQPTIVKALESRVRSLSRAQGRIKAAP